MTWRGRHSSAPPRHRATASLDDRGQRFTPTPCQRRLKFGSGPLSRVADTPACAHRPAKKASLRRGRPRCSTCRRPRSPFGPIVCGARRSRLSCGSVASRAPSVGSPHTALRPELVGTRIRWAGPPNGKNRRLSGSSAPWSLAPEQPTARRGDLPGHCVLSGKANPAKGRAQRRGGPGEGHGLAKGKAQRRGRPSEGEGPAKDRARRRTGPGDDEARPLRWGESGLGEAKPAKLSARRCASCLSSTRRACRTPRRPP
jgi:hypothetical protein